MNKEREKFLKSLRIDNRRKIINHPTVLKGRKFISKTIGKVKEIANKVKVNAIRIGATAAIGVMIATGATGCAEKVPTKPTTEMSDTGDTEKTEEEKALEAIETIDSIDEVENDFIKRYVEAYNEAYGTDYKMYDVDLLESKPSVVQVNGKYVAISSNNFKNKMENLKKYGEPTLYKNNCEIIQLVANENEVLGSYDIITGNSILSGTYQTNLISDDEYEAPTFEKLGISKNEIVTAGKAIFSRNSEGEQSRKMRIDSYKNARKAEVTVKTNDGFEIDDD